MAFTKEEKITLYKKKVFETFEHLSNMCLEYHEAMKKDPEDYDLRRELYNEFSELFIDVAVYKDEIKAPKWKEYENLKDIMIAMTILRNNELGLPMELYNDMQKFMKDNQYRKETNMELIEYKKKLANLVTLMTDFKNTSAGRDPKNFIDIIAHTVDIESSMKSDLKKLLDKGMKDNNFEINLLTIYGSALNECIKIMEVCGSKIMYTAEVCLPVVEQLLEILEDYTIDNYTAQRRATSRKIISEKVDTLILSAADLERDDSCGRYNMIEKLMDLLEYTNRDLEVEVSNPQSHLYIKKLKKLQYYVQSAIDFFVRTNIMYPINKNEFCSRALQVVVDMRPIVRKSFNIN